jgi:hypothetical protein
MWKYVVIAVILREWMKKVMRNLSKDGFPSDQNLYLGPHKYVVRVQTTQLQFRYEVMGDGLRISLISLQKSGK